MKEIYRKLPYLEVISIHNIFEIITTVEQFYY